MNSAPATWVFHRGSLGDSVLLWPMLRALRAGGGRHTLVTDGAKARLAAGELGVEGIDAEQRPLNVLWVEGAPVEPVPGVGRVIASGPDQASPRGRLWMVNARRMFPGAVVETLARRVDRRLAVELADRFGGVPVPPVRSNPGGPVVVHVGAGASEKRWPMELWRELARRVGPVVALSGEVEHERFTPEERRVFESMGGRFLSELMGLADVLKSARLFVGCDTGPTHLAAALGVPTVALFGPTDPEVWGPIGPSVRIVGAPAGNMRQLEAAAVVKEMGSLAAQGSEASQASAPASVGRGDE